MAQQAMRLAVALDGTGFHPASWREPSARPDELFTSQYWIDHAQTAERGLLDFLTIEDSLGLQSSRFSGSDQRIDQVRGRLDAVLIASLVAPLTSHIGLVPTATTTHTEPFHLASALSTLDYVSEGRAGWRPQVSSRADEAAHVGRRSVPAVSRSETSDDEAQRFVAELFEEAADAVEVVRRLWDSWEDDAIIRDHATGRFIDRDRLHYIDFEGRFFSVKGPSIVPRPPQGNPVIAALAHSRVPWEFAATSADIVFVTPSGTDDVQRWVEGVRTAEGTVGRTYDDSRAPLQIFADLVVFLDDGDGVAARRLVRLDDLAGRPLRSDASIFAGTPAELADQLVAWRRHGLDGFRLRPGVVGHDLEAIADGLVPELQQRDVFHSAYEAGMFRERLGLGRPPSRYAAARVGPASGGTA